MTATPDNALPTSEELRSCPWSAAIAGCSEAVHWRYSTALFRTADEANTVGKTGDYRALRLLGDVTSMHFRLDQPAAPLIALIRMGASRSAALEDFDAPRLTLLKELAPTLTDPELKARVCDVL